MPQWSNFLRLMTPLAPSALQKSNLSSLETTAIGMPPFGFSRHWCACTLVNCAKLPQLVSYPQIWKLGANIGSCPAFTDGSLRSQTPQWMTTSSPTLCVVTSLPTAYTTPEAS